MAGNSSDGKLAENAPQYVSFLNTGMLEALYERILYKFVVEKKYRDPRYSARKMAKELNTSFRYISAVMALKCEGNYSQLINGFRTKEAMYILKDPHYAHLSMNEVGQMVGFSHRRTFSLVFRMQTGLSPRAYRNQYAGSKEMGGRRCNHNIK